MDQERIAKSQLPLLPFGNRRAVRFGNATTLSGRLTAHSATKIEYWPTKRGEDFEFSFSSAISNNLRLVSSASTSLGFSSSDSPYGIVLLPLQGASIATRSGQTLAWGNETTGIYLPPGSTSGESGTRIVAGIDVDPQKLDSIASAMLGEEFSGRPVLDFESFRILDLIIGDINFLSIFKQYLALVDGVGGEGDRIESMGLSDMMLRSTVMLLAPHLFFSFEKRLVTPSQMVVARLCEYIEANLTTRITLTELERLSNLSARNLQYSFRSLTGMSPMQWIANRRLEAVRRDILAARPGISLSAIASIYFSNLGDFARYYRKRYGELPSETLSRAQLRSFRT